MNRIIDTYTNPSQGTGAVYIYIYIYRTIISPKPLNWSNFLYLSKQSGLERTFIQQTIKYIASAN